MQLSNKDFLLLDARQQRVYEEEHIPGALLPLPPDFYKDQELYRANIIPTMPDLDRALGERMSAYPKDKVIVTYCDTGCKASVNLMLQLKRAGFKNVRAMEEGISVWKNKGYPLAIRPPRLSSDSLQ